MKMPKMSGKQLKVINPLLYLKKILVKSLQVGQVYHLKINETESDRLLNLEQTLHDRVIGQNDAVTSISKAVRRARAGLKDPKRPIGSFIFLGPTGVGKTELARALAESMFGEEDAMIRVDMSEFMENML